MELYRFIKDGHMKAEFTELRQFVQYTISEVKYCSIFEHLNDYMVIANENGLDVVITSKGDIE